MALFGEQSRDLQRTAALGRLAAYCQSGDGALLD